MANKFEQQQPKDLIDRPDEAAGKAAFNSELNLLSQAGTAAHASTKEVSSPATNRNSGGGGGSLEMTSPYPADAKAAEGAGVRKSATDSSTLAETARQGSGH